MSNEMAVSDNATGEDATVHSDGAMVGTIAEVAEVPPEQPILAPVEHSEEPPVEQNDTPQPDPVKLEPDPEPETNVVEPPIVTEPQVKAEVEETEVPLLMDIKDEFEETDNMQYPDEDDKRGIKRRASDAFDDDAEFKGFEKIEDFPQLEYSLILERLEAEVKAASKGFRPLRTVMATPSAPARASKRPRKDTDGSRPSSALSSRSEDDVTSSASPAQRGRRTTSEMSSPLFRVPIELGWKRELVHRAALDAHSRRNADIYYYTPHGKKLRSMREIMNGTDRKRLWREKIKQDPDKMKVLLEKEKERSRKRRDKSKRIRSQDYNARVSWREQERLRKRRTRIANKKIGEHLSGTGLTLDNFTFFKEPLGLDDPEKEIIRDAKMVGGYRRVESPIASPAPVVVDGKRTPKPKQPKGASPEPPAKLKVKSMGSRLSGPAPAPAKKKPSPAPASPAPAPAPVPSTPDNNNTAAWKKPRAPQTAPPAPLAEEAPPAPAPAPPAPAPSAPVTQAPVTQALVIQAPVIPRLVTPPPPPPPLQSKPTPQMMSPDVQSPRQLVQPCSMSCGPGVPSLSCSACLCLYHPACAGFKLTPPPARFLCKNCRKSSSPPHDPPPLTHKSGVTASGVTPTVAVPTPRRLPTPQANTHKPNDKRVLLRMKVSGGGADGERVWAVAQPRPGGAPRPPAPATTLPAPTPRLLAIRGGLPQSLAIINGRRFIIVPRPAPLPNATTTQAQATHAAANEDKRRTRVANGVPAPPMAAVSPRRRGRPRADAKDEVDYFSAFYERSRETNTVVQIFQYLGMRDLAHCARVCRVWKELSATPALWRHVRMKNSQVNDWGGLCGALKRHGTKWLDLRKMLLPQNDIAFWDQFAQHIAKVDTLERLEMCRCPARAVEAASASLPALRSLSALAIRDAMLDPTPLAAPTQLRELRLKSMQGLALTADLTPLANLKNLHHLSLTSIKELGWRACDVVGELPNLESLELGECTFREEFGSVLARLTRLTRLRLERGTAHCAAPALLRALARLPSLTRLELVNIDVKVGFDDALAECKNIQRLLIIPTYVSQSATTNKQVLSGVLRLKETLTHLMWGVTIELLRVTELFIDQCSAGGGGQAKRELGECIPVLKPVPGCRLPMDHQLVAGPPQVEILPLPTLQRLLSAQLPNTKLKLLRIPFHATWRQSLADFQ